MMNKKYLLLLITPLLLLSCFNKKQNTELVAKDFVILTKGNSWVYNNPKQSSNIITEKGIQKWDNSNDKIRTYFRVEKTGTINIKIKAKVNSGKSNIKISLNGNSKKISLSNSEIDVIVVGNYEIKEAGYQFIELQGVSKTGAVFAEVEELIINGEATLGKMHFVKEGFYFGRRGPSVHLGYQIPEEANDIEYFYNEVTVPDGNDIVGSYFMAIGFAQGYFGIQVNSETERRILFSVWSPFKTDDPKSIPKDQRIKALKKGKDVVINDFGNEGSGGQSKRIYHWKSYITYKFLMKVKPSKNNSTNYTAYFYNAELQKWDLIAMFNRPKTNTYLKRPHSFLENFIPEMGDQERKVFFNNQWAFSVDKKWYKIYNAKFTADATARKQSRLDYDGGVKDDTFYLRNCGFFNANTKIDSIFSINKRNLKPPSINFNKLP